VLWEIVTGEIPTRGAMRNPRSPEECPQVRRTPVPRASTRRLQPCTCMLPCLVLRPTSRG
jgi:hypothetical protein